MKAVPGNSEQKFTSTRRLPPDVLRDLKRGKIKVSTLVSEGLLNASDSATGNSPLHIAVQFQHKKLAEALLRCPEVDLEARNRAAQTPLLAAADSRFWKALPRFLALPHVDLGARDEGGLNLIHLCCARGCPPKLLRSMLQLPQIEQGRLGEALTGLGLRPLHCAMSNGHAALVDELLHRDPSLARLPAGTGEYPLELALRAGSETVILKFLEIGEPDQVPKDMLWRLAKSRQYRLLEGIFAFTNELPPAEDISTQTSAASTSGRITRRTFSRKSSAKRPVRTKLLGTSLPLPMAVALRDSLLPPLNEPCLEGLPPCLWSLEKQERDLLAIFFAQPELDINATVPKTGENLLHKLFTEGVFTPSLADMIFQFLSSRRSICEGRARLPRRKAGEFSCPLNAKNSLAVLPPVHVPVWAVLVQTLINARDSQLGDSPLHRALKLPSLSEHRRNGIVSQLLREGADPNVCNNVGDSPLHIAARDVGSPALAKLLLQHGGKKDAKNLEGRTPLSYAEERQQDELVDALNQ